MVLANHLTCDNQGRSELDAEHGTRLTASDGGLLNDPDSDLDHQLEG